MDISKNQWRSTGGLLSRKIPKTKVENIWFPLRRLTVEQTTITIQHDPEVPNIISFILLFQLMGTPIEVDYCIGLK